MAAARSMRSLDEMERELRELVTPPPPSITPSPLHHHPSPSITLAPPFLLLPTPAPRSPHPPPPLPRGLPSPLRCAMPLFLMRVAAQSATPRSSAARGAAQPPPPSPSSCDHGSPGAVSVIARASHSEAQ
jgi:hypothetical protein